MVFGFGKKERDGKSFKDRVTDFWQWYPQNAVRLTQMIESRSDDIAEFMSTFMDQTMPGLAWVFGPGESGGHSFTVSGEGVVPKQLLAEYWHSRAHKIPNWTFHASRQATSPQRLEDFSIAVRGGQPIDTVSFMIQPTVDEEFAYVALDGSVIPSGEEVDARSKIADVISGALERDESGLAVGGAFGTENSYIDLIFFDGPNSEAIVSRVLDELQLAGRSSLKRFV